MPIVPPWPGIFDTLNNTIRELRELAMKNPNEPAIPEAIADIERAMSRLKTVAEENKTVT